MIPSCLSILLSILCTLLLFHSLIPPFSHYLCTNIKRTFLIQLLILRHFCDWCFLSLKNYWNLILCCLWYLLLFHCLNSFSSSWRYCSYFLSWVYIILIFQRNHLFKKWRNLGYSLSWVTLLTSQKNLLYLFKVIYLLHVSITFCIALAEIVAMMPSICKEIHQHFLNWSLFLTKNVTANSFALQMEYLQIVECISYYSLWWYLSISYPL